MEGDGEEVGEEEDMDVVAGDHGVIHGEVTHLEVVAVLEAKLRSTPPCERWNEIALSPTE